MANESTGGKERLRLALVGCGQILVHHMTALAALADEFEVVALCDPSAERRTIIRELGLNFKNNILSPAGVSEYDSLTTLLEQTSADECPILFISVPHDLHASLAMQAMDAGRHVVMEKPLAPTIDECRSLLTKAQKSKTMLIISEQSPYWEEVAAAKKLLQQGKIGTLVSASAYYYESMRDNVTSGTDESGNLGWRCSLKRCGGGIVIDGGLHWLRPLREWCGDIQEVVGVVRRHVQPGLQLEGESLAHALLKIRTDDKKEYTKQPDGSTGPLVATFSANMMHTAPMAHDKCPYFRLTGTKGELVVHGTGLNPNGGGGLKLYNEDNINGLELFSPDRQGGFFLGFQGIWKAAAKMLRAKNRVDSLKTVRDAAADVGVALSLYKSSETNRWELCDLFDDISQ